MNDKDRIGVGLIGCGTVGTGVLRILRDNARDIEARLGVPLEVRRVAVADPTKTRDPVVPAAIVTGDAAAVTDDPALPVVVEVMGGYEPARSLVLRALAAGKHVVTANKALLARHGAEIFAAADAAGRDVIFEAAVGGGIPVIRMLREAVAAERIERLVAIINGTSNFILSAMTTGGRSYEQALAEAQALGYAEADPATDVGGIDAAQKLAILAALGFGTRHPFEAFLVEGIGSVSALDIRYARTFGYVVKPLAVAATHPNGLEARVHPALVPATSMLGTVSGAFNAVMLQSSALGPMLFYGQGAGMLPTASAVVSDLVEVGRSLLRGIWGRLPHLAFHPHLVPEQPLRPAADVRCPFYLRFEVRDQPGVLASVAGILAHQGVSISRMVQDGRSSADEPVQVVMLTHTAREGDVRAALRAIDHLPSMFAPTRVIRVEDGDRCG